ncbi:PorT family protein [Flavobacteriaceae bacterium GSB9]|nr:PorT family protein [Flavobacteriaceae bacterium GSB9]
MKRFYLIVFLLFINLCFAQDRGETEVDSLYKEDHFYAGITYNLLGDRPTSVRQSGFSLGFHLGFIRDLPINDRRNWAIGIGLGYSANTFNQNLLVNKDNTATFDYSIIGNRDTFTKNKFTSHFVELPIEIRWRTSTPTEYNFWRIYTGFKLGYGFLYTVRHKGDLGDFKYNDNSDFNNLQYGLTLSAGYNTWNLHLYYALNPIFNKDAQLNGSNINMNAIKIGLMFYIL